MEYLMVVVLFLRLSLKYGKELEKLFERYPR